jgi:signal peptidase I
VKRGHVVVFKFPEDPSRDFIKRVIGLPGEKVEIRDKQVLIDGRPLDEPYVHFLEPPLRRDDPEYGLRAESIRDNWGPEVVPEGQLFVMGDNRDNSRDSRFWGFLPRDQVKGRALLVYWSYEASRDEYHRTGYVEWLKDTLTAFGRTRWNRFFHLIR